MTPALEPTSDEELAAIEDLKWVREHMGGYDELQSKQPQTLAHALTDSPVGLLGWHSQIFRGELDRTSCSRTSASTG